MSLPHGGKRAKAGRKPATKPKRTHSVQMTDDQHVKATRIGCGNLSRGVQVAVEMFERKVAS